MKYLSLDGLKTVYSNLSKRISDLKGIVTNLQYNRDSKTYFATNLVSAVGWYRVMTLPDFKDWSITEILLIVNSHFYKCRIRYNANVKGFAPSESFIKNESFETYHNLMIKYRKDDEMIDFYVKKDYATMVGYIRIIGILSESGAITLDSFSKGDLDYQLNLTSDVVQKTPYKDMSEKITSLESKIAELESKTTNEV